MSRLAATPRWSSLVRIGCWEWGLRAGTSGSSASMRQVNKITEYNAIQWHIELFCLVYILFSIADFPAGNVRVTVYSGGVPLSKAQLQYYRHMEEIASLLARAADPVDFMCQVKSIKGCCLMRVLPRHGKKYMLLRCIMGNVGCFFLAWLRDKQSTLLIVTIPQCYCQSHYFMAVQY